MTDAANVDVDVLIRCGVHGDVDEKNKTQELMDMILAKKRAPDRRSWLEIKGNLAELT